MSQCLLAPVDVLPGGFFSELHSNIQKTYYINESNGHVIKTTKKDPFCTKHPLSLSLFVLDKGKGTICWKQIVCLGSDALWVKTKLTMLSDLSGLGVKVTPKMQNQISVSKAKGI